MFSDLLKADSEKLGRTPYNLKKEILYV